MPETIKLSANKMSSGLCKNAMNKMFTNHIYLIYMYKKDLALDYLHWLICHKTQPNQIIYIKYICMKRIWL